MSCSPAQAGQTAVFLQYFICSDVGLAVISFALLAAAGDMGGSLGPWLTGVLTDAQIAAGTGTGMSLKRSALCAALLPLCAALAQWALGRRIKADEEEAA